ncbi:MAG TPA: glutathione transferase GstA [Gammaproteobacteria bacterium]|jgi:glutathione S-transferase|nr:glutathione transferase GstA [Gammaproteobacteria bacterium]
MKLYFSPGACSLASNIALHEAGLPVELEVVKDHKLKDGTDFYKINPKGYVPVVQLDDGEILTEGAALLQYIGDQAPQANLIPKPGTLARFRANEWLTFISSEIHKGFSPLFNKELKDDAKEVLKAKLRKRFDLLDRHFADHVYLMGEQFTVADAYLYTVVSWAPHVGLELSTWKHLSDYRQRVADRPKVREALQSERAAA